MDDRETPTVVERGGHPRKDPEPRETTSSAFDPPDQRFEARGELGRGGMGRVDDAFDLALDRPVAIKHMLSASPVDLARFEREAKITARLEHPGIVPIHDAGRTPDGTPYYVMRRVDGQPLDQRVTKDVKLRLALIPNVLAACDAVAFAHARNVVHRDIKPTNILVGPFGETLVIDWGLAREIGSRDDGTTAIPSTDQGLTRAGTVAGTPGFMSPEQARGESVDARADVFALGATLYFVLAGALPYGSASATEMIDLAGAGRSADWSKVPSDVPPELVAIAKKAMAAETEDRYRDAGELAADLRRFITGNLVTAHEYSAGQRFVRFVKKYRAAVAVSAIAIVVVAAAIVVSVRRVLAERDTAQQQRVIAETQQAEAQSAADLLRVQHALELSDSDPVSAISLLRTIPLSSKRWAEARVAAQSAFVKGVPFGYRGPGTGATLVVTRDGSRVLVGPFNAGDVMIVDTKSHVRTRFKYGKRARGYAWLGMTHIAITNDHDVDIYDTKTLQVVRTLDYVSDQMSSNHEDRAWMVTHDHQLVELNGWDAEPKVLLTDIRDSTADPELTETVVSHMDGTREFVRGALHVPLAKDDALYNLRGDTIAKFTWDSATRMHLAGTKIVEDGDVAGKRRYFSVLPEKSGGYFVFSGEGVGLYRKDGYLPLDNTYGMVFATAAGTAQAIEDGSVRLVDSHGIYNLGRKAQGLARVDTSEDGEVVAALTSDFDLLVWDLAGVRPIQRELQIAWTVVGLTPHYLWMQHVSRGIAVVDLKTGDMKQLTDDVISGPVYFDRKDERWVAHQTMNRVVIYDFAHDTRIYEPARAYDGWGTNGVIVAHEDGSLLTWVPGDATWTPRGKLAWPKPTRISTGANVVYAVYVDHVDRFDLLTQKTERAEIGIDQLISVDEHGTAYMETTEPKVWRWEIGHAPVEFDTPVIPDAIVTGQTGRVLLWTTTTISIWAHEVLRTLQLPSKLFGWNGDNQLVSLNAKGVPQITDIDSGFSFTLPTTANNATISADQCAVTHSQTVEIWSYGLPHDPKQLQAWLAGITNAQQVPGSDAYTFP
ncbi:MAG: serine/threonine-protein kinase [Kofleriaceae bacterium]